MDWSQAYLTAVSFLSHCWATERAEPRSAAQARATVCELIVNWVWAEAVATAIRMRQEVFIFNYYSCLIIRHFKN